MSINLVTVCGHNTTMLRHMLNHYKDMVDDIFVVVYLSSDKDRVLSEVKEDNTKLARQIDDYMDLKEHFANLKQEGVI